MTPMDGEKYTIPSIMSAFVSRSSHHVLPHILQAHGMANRRRKTTSLAAASYYDMRMKLLVSHISSILELLSLTDSHVLRHLEHLTTRLQSISSGHRVNGDYVKCKCVWTDLPITECFQPLLCFGLRHPFDHLNSR